MTPHILIYGQRFSGCNIGLMSGLPRTRLDENEVSRCSM